MTKNINDIKNTFYKIGCKKIAFNLWGLYKNNFYYLSKSEIKEIKRNLNKATKQEQETIKKYINQWCELYRCHSEYIK